MQLKTKAGVALVFLGIAILGAWNWWTKTRNLNPVSVPIPAVAGQTITSHFKLNFDGLYLIEIQADQAILPDTLHCLMGLQADPVQCKHAAPAIAANWVLHSEGHKVVRGNSTELHAAPPESATTTRVIGEFQGQAGREYTLQAVFTADASSLAPAHPRLKVAVASIAYTDLQSAAVLVLSLAFICALFGAILLGISFYTKRV